MHDLDQINDYVVIGSGPTAVSCLSSLIEKGIRPIVLDFGLESIKNFGSNERGHKVWFNSAASYQQPVFSRINYHKDIKVRPSYGLGGFSRVWGATCNLNYDFSKWPENIRPSDSDIKLVSDLLNPSTFDISVEFSGEQVHKTVESLSSELISMKPTLAIDTRSTSRKKCINLGTCLTGCEVDSIWYAGGLIRNWSESDLIEYRSGVLVEKLIAHENFIEIQVKVDNEFRIVKASKVFLATGVLSTSQILINSKILDEVEIKETPTYFLAAIAIQPGGPPLENKITLSKAWVTDAANSFLVQLYSPGEGNMNRIQGALPALISRGPILKLATKYLMPLIIYAKEVPAAKMFYNSERERIEIIPIKSKNRRTQFKRIIKLIRKPFSKSWAFIPPHQLFFKREILTGYHFGASISHGKITDQFGQISGFDNIHIIDASVLPEINPGSIVSIAMINAARITRRVITDC